MKYMYGSDDLEMSMNLRCPTRKNVIGPRRELIASHRSKMAINGSFKVISSWSTGQKWWVTNYGDAGYKLLVMLIIDTKNTKNDVLQ